MGEGGGGGYGRLSGAAGGHKQKSIIVWGGGFAINCLGFREDIKSNNNKWGALYSKFCGTLGGLKQKSINAGRGMALPP